MSELYGVLTRTDDDYAVSFERDYPTSARDLWSALTEPDRIARWLDPVDGDFRVGGEVVVHFDDGDAVYVVDHCEPPVSLAVRWRHPDRETVVRASVFDLGEDRSRLTLVHERLAARPAPLYAGGWHWYLDSLGGLLDADGTHGTNGTDRPEWDDLAAHYQAGMADVRAAHR